jgi:hypothetical protein
MRSEAMPLQRARRPVCAPFIARHIDLADRRPPMNFVRPAHSSLSAIIGSVFAARSAGMKEATAATHTSSNGAATNVSGKRVHLVLRLR